MASRIISALALAGVCMLSNLALATPAEVLLVRHAEKPSSGPDLNARGYQRAQALVSFFETSPEVTRFGLPTAIYAAAPKHEGSSLRSIETVTPIADALGLKVDTDYTKKQVDDAVHEIMKKKAYDGKTVLMAWEHKLIPDLAAAFGVDDAPDTWASDVFDRVWVIDFDDDGNVTSFQNLPQHVLPGDSDD